MSPQNNGLPNNDAARALLLAEELRKDMDGLNTWKEDLERRYREDKQWANNEHTDITKLVTATKDALMVMIGNLKDAIHGVERAMYVLILTSVILPLAFLVLAHYLWK